MPCRQPCRYFRVIRQRSDRLYDIIIKDGHVIDPASNINEKADVAIENGRIARVQKDIDSTDARAVYPVPGKYIVPGLIDAHCHPVGDFTGHAVPADEAGVDAGVLLVNDAGSSGSANFHVLRSLLRNSRTSVSYFINFASCGLIRLPEIASVHDFNVEQLKEVVGAAGGMIRGVKIRAMEAVSRIDMDVVALAKKTAEELRLPLMIHIGEFRQRKDNDPFDVYSRNVVSLLGKGDIISHYMSWRPGGMVLEDGTIFPELEQAKKRGVILDCSHGRNNFSLKVAQTLLDNGFPPDIITTDLSSLGREHVQSLAVTMSKFLAMGMPLKEVIAAVTINAAKALGLSETWGSLKVGRSANITILDKVDGNYRFFDGSAGNSITGNALLEPRLIFVEGKPASCRSFYHLPQETLS